MKVAALDLGSNSFLCLIARAKNNELEVLSDEIEAVRLGQGLARGPQKKIHPEALERAAKALAKFQSRIYEIQVDQILAYATSAARDAENAHLLLDLGKKYGISIEIISGDKEAYLTYYGSVKKNSSDLVVDVGGGSTEYFWQHQGNIEFQSLNIGAVRLSELFAEKSKQELISFIRNQLQVLPKEYSQDSFVAVAGTATCLASLKHKLEKFDENKIDQTDIGLDEAEVLLEKVFSASIEERKSMPGMPESRADIFPFGLQIFIESLKYFSCSSLRVSTKGLRYGIAKEMLGLI